MRARAGAASRSRRWRALANRAKTVAPSQACSSGLMTACAISLPRSWPRPGAPPGLTSPPCGTTRQSAHGRASSCSSVRLNKPRERLSSWTPSLPCPGLGKGPLRLLLRCSPREGLPAPPPSGPRPCPGRRPRRPPSPRPTAAHAVYECECGERYLGQQQCDQCHRFCRAAELSAWAVAVPAATRSCSSSTCSTRTSPSFFLNPSRKPS